MLMYFLLLLWYKHVVFIYQIRSLSKYRSKQHFQLSVSPKGKSSLFPLEQPCLHTQLGVHTAPPKLF
jgi:hypothetical protein